MERSYYVGLLLLLLTLQIDSAFASQATSPASKKPQVTFADDSMEFLASASAEESPYAKYEELYRSFPDWMKIAKNPEIYNFLLRVTGFSKHIDFLKEDAVSEIEKVFNDYKLPVYQRSVSDCPDGGMNSLSFLLKNSKEDVSNFLKDKPDIALLHLWDEMNLYEESATIPNKVNPVRPATVLAPFFPKLFSTSIRGGSGLIFAPDTKVLGIYKKNAFSNKLSDLGLPYTPYAVDALRPPAGLRRSTTVNTRLEIDAVLQTQQKQYPSLMAFSEKLYIAGDRALAEGSEFGHKSVMEYFELYLLDKMNSLFLLRGIPRNSINRQMLEREISTTDLLSQIEADRTSVNPYFYKKFKIYWQRFLEQRTDGEGKVRQTLESLDATCHFSSLCGLDPSRVLSFKESLSSRTKKRAAETGTDNIITFMRKQILEKRLKRSGSQELSPEALLMPRFAKARQDAFDEDPSLSTYRFSEDFLVSKSLTHRLELPFFVRDESTELESAINDLNMRYGDVWAVYVDLSSAKEIWRALVIGEFIRRKTELEPNFVTVSVEEDVMKMTTISPARLMQSFLFTMEFLQKSIWPLFRKIQDPKNALQKEELSDAFDALLQDPLALMKKD